MLSRVFETVKTVIIFMLCVTMLVMTLLLMASDQGNDEVAYPFEERMIFYGDSADATNQTGMDTLRMMPTAIAMRSPSQMEEDRLRAENATLRVVLDGALLPNVYTSLYPLLQEMLGYAAVGTTVEDGEALWMEALGAENLLYMVYAGDLPSALIFAYTFDDSAFGESQTLPTHSAYCKELIFFEEKETAELLLLARASDGTVTRFVLTENGAQDGDATASKDGAPTIETDAETAMDGADLSAPNENSPTAMSEGEDTSLHALELSAYIEIVGNLAKEAHPGCFLCQLPKEAQKPRLEETEPTSSNEGQMGSGTQLDGALSKDGEEVTSGAYLLGMTNAETDTALVYWGVRSLPNVTLSRFGGMQVLDANESEGLYLLLHTIGMRDSAVENHYIDRDGGRVYLDADGRLYIAPDGALHYAALQNGGIPGSALLGYSNINGVYSLSESLQISDRLVTVFSKNIIPMLCAVEQEVSENGNALQTPILSVTSVMLEGGVSGVHVRYGYAIDGVPLCDADGNALSSFSVVISGDAVVSASLLPLIATEEEKSYLLPMQVALRAMTYENVPSADTYGILKAAYVVPGTEAPPKVLSPEWLFLEK